MYIPSVGIISDSLSLQLIKLTALYSIYGKNQLILNLACHVTGFDVINLLLILSNNNENVSFT